MAFLKKSSVVRHSSVRVGVLASLIAALMVAAIQFLLTPIVTDPVLAALIATFLASLAGWALIRLRIVNPLTILGARYIQGYTGIARVYPTLHDAFPDLHEAFLRAKRIDLLLQIGRREFGVQDGLFSNLLRDRAKDQNFEIRVLHVDENSPYLSEDCAQRLGKRREKWMRDVRYVREQIVELAGGAKNVRLATHHEPFVWRVFIFDSVMFVSGYLYKTKNDEQAPVFRIHAGPNSLYAAFQEHFDHLWRVYAARSAKDG